MMSADAKKRLLKVGLPMLFSEPHVSDQFRELIIRQDLGLQQAAEGHVHPFGAARPAACSSSSLAGFCRGHIR